MSGIDRTPAATAAPPEPRISRFRVGDMDCASCVRKIEGHLGNVEGVLEVSGSPVSRTLTVRHAEGVDLDRVRAEVGKLGYTARPHAPGSIDAGGWSAWKGRQARITYAAMALVGAGLVLRVLGQDAQIARLPLQTLDLADAFFLIAATVGGLNFFGKGLRAARYLRLDMNFLMTVAILGAAAIGETLEAAAIAFLFSLAELLERFSVDRARASVEALVQLAPDAARVIRGGVEVTVPAEELVTGDLVLVRPGERIPADGRVEEGCSAVDESAITGESMPLDKSPGDEVFAGTVNREGFLQVGVMRPAAESTLARIVHLVEEAEGRKSRSERFVERFARYYTPTVTVVAVLLVALPPLLLGAPFLTWFVRGLTLLVIACPCALVISTPVAVVSGITAAARNGVLIKGGTYLEALGGVEVVAFDKTGTLTHGHPAVVRVLAVDGLGENEVLARAAAVETGSEHPIARAIAREARARGLELPWAVSGFTSLRGVGARARLDGVDHKVGRPEPSAGGREAAAAEDRATIVTVSAGGRALGSIALDDRPRAAAATAVSELREAGVGRLVMLTGDHAAAGRAVGLAVGLDEVRAGLLPEQKVEAVEELTARWGPVAMVGDGVNDAPALAVSTVGVAMGAAGSDTALETADVALMADDLRKLPYLMELSKRARNVIRQNIAAAILVKAVLAVGVPLGLVSLVAAVVIGDMGVSLAVTLNALRLGRVGA